MPITSRPDKTDFKDICFLMEEHYAKGVGYKKIGQYLYFQSSDKAVKVGCGKVIDAEEYEKKHKGFFDA